MTQQLNTKFVYNQEQNQARKRFTSHYTDTWKTSHTKPHLKILKLTRWQCLKIHRVRGLVYCSFWSLECQVLIFGVFLRFHSTNCWLSLDVVSKRVSYYVTILFFCFLIDSKKRLLFFLGNCLFNTFYTNTILNKSNRSFS